MTSRPCPQPLRQATRKMGISHAPRLFGGMREVRSKGRLNRSAKAVMPSWLSVRARPGHSRGRGATHHEADTSLRTVGRRDNGGRSYRALSTVCPARPVLVETQVGGGKTADPTPGECSTKKPSRLFPVGRNLSVTLWTASPANLHASFHYALPAALPAADGLRRHLSSRNTHPAVLRHILTLPLHILGRGLDRGRLRCRGN